MPENVEMSSPPTVNSKIWKFLDKHTHSNNKAVQHIQTLLASAMMPVIDLAKTMRNDASITKETKVLESNALTLMGQVQINLSLQRRYSIPTNINRKYLDCVTILCQSQKVYSVTLWRKT